MANRKTTALNCREATITELTALPSASRVRRPRVDPGEVAEGDGGGEPEAEETVAEETGANLSVEKLVLNDIAEENFQAPNDGARRSIMLASNTG